MKDIYSKITSLDSETIKSLADVLERRALDDQQKVMLNSYINDISFPENAKVLEIGCGTGPVIRRFAEIEKVSEAIGLDPSPYFIEQSKENTSDVKKLSFVIGDALSLPFDNGIFDVAVFHTTLCHIPDTIKALKEAKRVLKKDATLAIFDGDYSSLTLASSENDPLKVVADAAKETIAHHPYIIHHLPAILAYSGFSIVKQKGYCYTGVRNPAYMLSVVDRGADALLKDRKIGKDLAEALRKEVRRRISFGTFYGYINYASIIASNKNQHKDDKDNDLYIGGIPLSLFDELGINDNN